MTILSSNGSIACSKSFLLIGLFSAFNNPLHKDSGFLMGTKYPYFPSN
jgi:hypothetical protein